MSTYFGEILPLYSRAIPEYDDDEDHSFHNVSHVQWTDPSCGSPLACNTLIVATGPTASAFIESCIMDQNDDILATVTVEENLENKKVSVKNKVSLHRLQRDPKCFVLRSGTEVIPEQAFDIVHKIFERIPKSALVVVLCTGPSVDYKGENGFSSLKALKTSSFDDVVPATYLETPNIIGGLPAQVMTHCEVEQRRAVLFVLYMKTMYFDSSCAEFFKAVFKLPSLAKYVEDVAKSKEQLTKKANQYAQNHHFYT